MLLRCTATNFIFPATIITFTDYVMTEPTCDMSSIQTQAGCSQQQRQSLLCLIMSRLLPGGDSPLILRSEHLAPAGTSNSPQMDLQIGLHGRSSSLIGSR